MDRAELLKIAKPVLFNTEMVIAILENRKGATRRCVKYKYSNTEMKMHSDKYGTRLIEIQKNVEGETYGRYPDGKTWQKLLPYIEKKPPFKKGDYLYVRESVFQGVAHSLDMSGETVGFLTDDFEYFADGIHQKDHWKDKNQNVFMRRRPSIHMPKEAARLFLKVTDVRVERLQDITLKEIEKEGLINPCVECYAKRETCEDCICRDEYVDRLIWSELWNSTIKRPDLDKYGWEANPWVWVIEFERVEV